MTTVKSPARWAVTFRLASGKRWQEEMTRELLGYTEEGVRIQFWHMTGLTTWNDTTKVEILKIEEVKS